MLPRYHYFIVYQVQDSILISVPNYQYIKNITIYIDDLAIKFNNNKASFSLKTNNFPVGSHILTIIGWLFSEGHYYKIEENYYFSINKKKPLRTIGKEDFKPGDILISSDNAFGIPPGYMGHSVLVIDDKNILESVYRLESIRIKPLKSFFDDHERYAHFRPKDERMGKAAVAWGLKYYNEYQEKLKKGKNVPVFSFVPSKNMKEIWDTIYCSKLIWFCYYFGANHEIPMHGLWISPQNLNDELAKDDQFELVYKHPEHTFKINL